MASRGLRGLMAIGGGALAGIGQGLASAGEEKRAAALEALRHQRELERDDRRFAQQRELAAEDRAFRGDEAAADREFRERMQGESLGHAERMEAGRQTFTAGENRLNRAADDRRQANDQAFRRREGETDRQFRERMQEQEQRARQEAAEAERAWRGAESEKDRDFRSGEADADRRFRAGEGEKERGARATESAADREHRERMANQDAGERRGLLNWVQPDAEGNLYGITPGGDVKNLGIKGKGSATGEFTPADKRLWDTVIARHTSGKGTLEGESTDWDSAAAEFAQRGRNDLARLAVPEPPAGGSPRIDVNSAEWREAVRQAEAEASGRTGLFTTRGSEFPETNGNMEAWVNQRAMELYRSFRGQPVAPDGGSGQKKTGEGRPIVDNDDGSISTERTITITDERINNGRPTNIPSMFGGKQVSEQEAIERIVQAGGKDPETGRALPAYETIDEAVKAARERSEWLGRQYGGGDSPPAPPAPRSPAQRKVGQVYTTPDGRRVQWMGNGWKLVE